MGCPPRVDKKRDETQLRQFVGPLIVEAGNKGASHALCNGDATINHLDYRVLYARVEVEGFVDYSIEVGLPVSSLDRELFRRLPPEFLETLDISPGQGS